MNKIAKRIFKFINFSLKVDANSTSTGAAFQPKVPKKLSNFKKNKWLTVYQKG